MTARQDFDIDLLRDPQRGGLDFINDVNQLREMDPVHWSKASNCWIVTRFEDVSDGFECRVPLLNAGRNEFSLASIPVEERELRIPTISHYVNHWIVGVDGEEHARLRKLVMKAFTKKMVEKLRPYVRERVNFLLDKAMESPEIEFNEQIARPLPGYVIFKMAGIPEEHFASLREWANAVVEGMTSSMPPPEVLENTEKATVEMGEVCKVELEKRKTDPKDDLLTALLQATEEGDRLTMDELLATMNVVIIAGHDTTSNTMTMGVEALSRHPEAWQYMYEHPDRMQDCILELMRYIGMSSGQPRIVGEDFKWHGKQLKKGDIVFLSVIGANFDPREWSEPDKLDFFRNNSNSQVFAPGVHHCIGHLLAKLQLVEFFTALVNRFESVEILDRKLDFMPVGVFRGLYGMNVRFHPRT